MSSGRPDDETITPLLAITNSDVFGLFILYILSMIKLSVTLNT